MGSGANISVIITTGALTHSQRAKVAQMSKVRTTFRYIPESRNGLTDGAFHRIQHGGNRYWPLGDVVGALLHCLLLCY